VFTKNLWRNVRRRLLHWQTKSVGLLLFAVLVLVPACGGAQTTATRMAALPGHFGIGAQSGQSDVTWMSTSGVPWDYRYQYINPGWTSWNSPTGQFAANYTAQSLANHYVPVFTWYELGGTYPEQPLNYIASPTFMAGYYADFALLMQKIASVSTVTTPVIVHVEPDLWGLMQQNYGDDPRVIPASVASSGFAGLGALSNNVAGFAQALVAIRDTFAANVILAWNASLWGPNNGFDPTDITFYSWDTPQVTGARIATFYKGLGAPFDMIFHDPSDADAAYKVIVRGQSSSTAWWTDSAFTNYLQYIGAVYQGTGLQSMLWQVPTGNTLYQSTNNTKYHYQDNRPQYFLTPGNSQHIADYLGQGVIGLLFGFGGGTTDYMDYANDGITNPPPICGNPFCNPLDRTTFNTLVATVADDDGGFLRTAAAAYYDAGPISTSGPISTPPPTTFAIGAGVETTTTVYVYQNKPLSKQYKIEPAAALGTIGKGPSSSGGYIWWFVSFSKASGWVVQKDLSVQ
jgi:hypothetical protein